MMELHVACDICGHRYVLPNSRAGREIKCKSCGVAFEVVRDNFYDPDTTEFDEPSEDESNESSLTPVWDLARKVGHVLAGLVTVSMLVWMCSLMLRSPQEAARAMAPAGVGRRL